MRRLAMAALLALVSTACAGPTGSPSPTRLTGTLALPSATFGPNDLCAGVGLSDAVLAGDPRDPRLAWLIQPMGRREVLVPPWLGARFTPELEIVDPAGQVVARAGDRISGGCVWGDPDNAVVILWH